MSLALERYQLLILSFIRFQGLLSKDASKERFFVFGWVVNGLKKDETNARSTVDNSSSNTPLPLNRGSGVLVSTVGKGAPRHRDVRRSYQLMFLFFGAQGIHKMKPKKSSFL